MADRKQTYRVLLQVFRIRGGGPLPIVTGTRRGDRKLLAEVCKRLGFRTGAEIGVRDGSFAAMFCRAGLKMYCVDPWAPVPKYSQGRQDQLYASAAARMAGFEAVFIKKPSAAAVGDVPDALDFIHIDGDHEFDPAMRDLLDYAPKVHPGGIVACHDYHLPGVKRAVEAYTLAHHIDPWFALKNHQPTAFWVA